MILNIVSHQQRKKFEIILTITIFIINIIGNNIQNFEKIVGLINNSIHFI